jgi:surfactin synthase thioesterase subunit
MRKPRRRHKPADAASRVNLLCLPCAGASATMYLRWRRLLSAWVQLVPVEPGFGDALRIFMNGSP